MNQPDHSQNNDLLTDRTILLRYHRGYQNQLFQDIRHEMEVYFQFSTHVEQDYVSARMCLLIDTCLQVCGSKLHPRSMQHLAQCTYHMGRDLYTNIRFFLERFEPASKDEAHLPATYFTLCQALEQIDEAHKALSAALHTIASLKQPYPHLWMASAAANVTTALRSALHQDPFSDYRQTKLREAITLIQSALEFKD